MLTHHHMNTDKCTENTENVIHPSNNYTM